MSTVLSSIPQTRHGDDDDDEEGRRHYELWRSAYNTLTSYLQENSTLPIDEAVDRVNECWDSNTTLCVAVLIVPIAIAKQTPYDHPNHKKLADFMLALERRRSELNPPPPGCDSFGNFAIYLRDFIDRPDDIMADTEDHTDPITFANYCAFLANMVFPDGRFHFLAAGEILDIAMRIGPAAITDVRDAWVIGAAQFIVYQAPAIFKVVLKDCQRQEKLGKWKGWYVRLSASGRRFKHEYNEFTWNDWQAWKHAFGAAAVNETHGKTCRDIAERAADLMALEEKIEEYRVQDLQDYGLVRQSLTRRIWVKVRGVRNISFHGN